MKGIESGIAQCDKRILKGVSPTSPRLGAVSGYLGAEASQTSPARTSRPAQSTATMNSIENSANCDEKTAHLSQSVTVKPFPCGLPKPHAVRDWSHSLQPIRQIQ